MHRPGLIVSGIIHLLLLLLPFSTDVARHSPDKGRVELVLLEAVEHAPAAEEIKVPREEPVAATVRAIKTPEVEQQVEPRPTPPEEEQAEKQPVQIPQPDMLQPLAREEQAPEEIAVQPLAEASGQKPVTPALREESDRIAEHAEASLAEAIEAIRLPDFSPLKDRQEEEQVTEVDFGTDDGPDFIHRQMPVYPPQALRLEREATVILILTIDRVGALTDIEVIQEAGYGFTDSAIEAVRNSTFRPAQKNGIPVKSRARLPVRFQIRR